MICYDKTVCWRHPQNGQESGPTDAAIVSTHMMLEAASLGLGTVWISYFRPRQGKGAAPHPGEL
jgi:nitroreductase